MTHYKTMYDESDMLFAADIYGKGDVVVTIERVEAGAIVGEKGRKTKKPFVSFRGTKKRLALNKTNGRTISQLYGPDVTQWPGKTIALYATTTTFGNETVDCVRVRPAIPKPKAGAAHKVEASTPEPTAEYKESAAES